MAESNLNAIIRLFRRSTNSTYFIPEIDGLRFYAIITVVLFHLNSAFSRQIGYEDLGASRLGGVSILGSPAWFIVRLDLGVKVFFSISGMVLALPFLRNYLLNGPEVSLKDYFYRRLTRLEPPFIITLVLFLGVHVVLLGEPLQQMLPHLGAGLLYAHVLIFGVPNPINPVTWSLETEAQFYIIVPLLLSCVFYFRNYKWQYLAITLLFVTSVFLRNYFVSNDVKELVTSAIAFMSNFLVGIIFTFWYLLRPNFFKNKNLVWDFIGILSVATQFLFYKPQHDYLNNILFNASVFVMMSAVFKGYIFNWFFTRPVIYIIGGMCYSIYLLHYAFLHLLVKYTALIPSTEEYLLDLLIQILISLPAILIFSTVFFLLIEKPCMNKNWPTALYIKLKTLKGSI